MIGCGGFHPVASSFEMSARLEFNDQLAVDVAQHRDRREVRLRVAVDEVPAGRRHRDVVIRIFGRQQLRRSAVHAHAIQVREVRIAPWLSADRLEEEHAGLVIDTEQLCDVAVAGRDLVFELAGLQIVEIELTPIVALRKPDHFIRRRQVSPVDAAVA